MSLALWVWPTSEEIKVCVLRDLVDSTFLTDWQNCFRKGVPLLLTCMLLIQKRSQPKKCPSTVDQHLNWQITDRLQTVGQYQTWMQNIEQKRHILIMKLLSHTSSAWTIVILHSSHRLTGYTSLPIFQMMRSTVSVSQRHSIYWGRHVLWTGLSLTCLFCPT